MQKVLAPNIYQSNMHVLREKKTFNLGIMRYMAGFCDCSRRIV